MCIRTQCIFACNICNVSKHYICIERVYVMYACIAIYSLRRRAYLYGGNIYIYI
jgi:hypothetical protein